MLQEDTIPERLDSQRPMLIYTFTPNGFTDMMRSTIGMYKMCKLLGYHFKIYIKKPFVLEDYLIPNRYDWTMTEQEYDIAIRENNSLSFHPSVNINSLKELFISKCENKKYIFINGHPHSVFTMDEYRHLFDELFKPSLELQETLNVHLHKMVDSGEYISVTFRFIHLLGDFKDNADAPILEESEKKVLILQCLEHIQKIHRENRGNKIFVTSDSVTFLKEIEKFEYVYIVPGKIAHPCFSNDVDKLSCMKFFLDYFLLSCSKIIFQIIDGLMFSSQIPKYAASHGNVPFVVINMNDIRFRTITKKLYPFLYVTSKNELYFKEAMTQNALSCLLPKPTNLFWDNVTGRDIYGKLQDEESRIIYKELFYHHCVTESDWHINNRTHYIGILMVTLQKRFIERNRTVDNKNAILISPDENNSSLGLQIDNENILDDRFVFGNKYFDLPFLLPKEEEVFVDAGSFIGDSIQGFLKFSNNKYKHIYSFEPNQDNYIKLCENIKKWNTKNISLIPKGLYKVDTSLLFSGVGFDYSACHDGESNLPVTSIDSFLGDRECVTFIKMCINGLELQALRGASDTIRRCKPRMAICIFHNPKEDIVNIPAILLKLVPEYKFYIRHHSFSIVDTVLYAIVDDNKQESE